MAHRRGDREESVGADLDDHVVEGAGTLVEVPDQDGAELVLGFEVDIRWAIPELPGFRLAYIKKDDFLIFKFQTADQAEAWKVSLPVPVRT